MRLDMDCVRDILVCVEDNTSLRTRCVFVDDVSDTRLKAKGLRSVEMQDYQKELLTLYDHDKLMYHVRYCIEAGLISEFDDSNPHVRYIADLTVKGHELLANIRNDSNWVKIKNIGGKVGFFGLNNVFEIGKEIFILGLKQHLGLP